MASQLALTLPFLIKLNQSAFLKDRLINENILIAHELVRNFHHLTRPKRFCIKVDLKEAFDKVHWDFFLSVLRDLGFNNTWTSWITDCVTNPSFSVLITGCNFGFFKSKSGLRQGCPLSPLLFILYMEALSVMLETKVSEGLIMPPMTRNAPKVSHLLFVDDLLIFSKDSLQLAWHIKSTLQEV